MRLESFRELLLKKTGDSELGFLVKYIKDELLEDMIEESLEKMAEHDAGKKGNKANNAITHFAKNMDHETEPAMIHDALSHHASRYKASVGAGRQDLANMHAKQLFNIMYMSKRVGPNSNGKLHVDGVDPRPWERHGKTKQYDDPNHPRVQSGKAKLGEFVNNADGWKYKGNDYGWLQQAPHESRASEIRKHGHNKAYPLEEISVNGKKLHIEDIDPSELKGAKGHEFDNHPIMQHYRESASSRDGTNRDEQYRKAHDEYQDSHHMDSYWDRHEEMEAKDPEGYAKRGGSTSSPVHGDIEGLDYEQILNPGAKPEDSQEDSNSYEDSFYDAIENDSEPEQAEDTASSDDSKLPSHIVNNLKNLPPHILKELENAGISSDGSLSRNPERRIATQQPKKEESTTSVEDDRERGVKPQEERKSTFRGKSDFSDEELKDMENRLKDTPSKGKPSKNKDAYYKKGDNIGLDDIRQMHSELNSEQRKKIAGEKRQKETKKQEKKYMSDKKKAEEKKLLNLAGVNPDKKGPNTTKGRGTKKASSTMKPDGSRVPFDVTGIDKATLKKLGLDKDGFYTRKK